MIVAEGGDYVNVSSNGRIASMGPQLDSCGRGNPPAQSLTSNLLQWGRNLIVAEGVCAVSVSSRDR